MMILSYFLRDWSFCSLNSKGKLGGIVIEWKESLEFITLTFLVTSIQTKLGSNELRKLFTIINLYGPYEKRKAI